MLMLNTLLPQDQEIKVADFLEKEFQVSAGLGYLRDMATKRWCKSCYEIVRQEVGQHLTPGLGRLHEKKIM